MAQPDERGLLQIVELLGQSLKANQQVQTEIYNICKQTDSETATSSTQIPSPDVAIAKKKEKKLKPARWRG